MARVKCIYCGQDVAKAANRLKTHLTTCIKFTRIMAAPAPSGSPMNGFVDSMARNDNVQLQAALAHCIIKRGLPFNLFDNAPDVLGFIGRMFGKFLKGT